MSEELKIAVYAICKNESEFLERFYNSVRQADYIVFLDTGSTDGTYKMLQSLSKFDSRSILKNTDEKEIIYNGGKENDI